MDLRYFINQCAEANELRRIKAEVDWNLEISHVSKLTEEKKGPALLFEKVSGYDTPAKPIITTTSIASLAVSVVGGISIVIAAITAAVATLLPAAALPSAMNM